MLHVWQALTMELNSDRKTRHEARYDSLNDGDQHERGQDDRVRGKAEAPSGCWAVSSEGSAGTSGVGIGQHRAQAHRLKSLLADVPRRLQQDFDWLNFSPILTLIFLGPARIPVPSFVATQVVPHSSEFRTRPVNNHSEHTDAWYDEL